MYKKNHLMVPISLAFSIFLFAFADENNFYMLPSLLAAEGLSAGEIEYFELLEMLGNISAGFILTQLVNVVRRQILIIFSLIFFIISMISLMLIRERSLLDIYFLVMSISSFSYVVLLFIRIIEYTGSNKNYGLVAFFLLWAAGHFWGEYFKDFFVQQNLNKLVINTSFYCLMLIAAFFDEEPIDDTEFYYSKFAVLLENIELQVVTVFIISYVNMSIFWYYDAFAVVKNLAITNMRVGEDFMWMGIILFLLPVMYLVSKLNKYLLNLLFVLGFLVSFTLLALFEITEINNIILLTAIGLFLCSIFVCNISIISDKFVGNELRTSLSIYFTMAIIGSYCGAFSAHIGGDISNNKFISSTCLIILFFLLYYLWRFIKLKLYQPLINDY